MEVDKAKIYQFAIQGGILELSFAREGVLHIEVTPSEAPESIVAETSCQATESLEAPESLQAAERMEATQSLQAALSSLPTPDIQKESAGVRVLVEESVVSFAATSLRVVVWKYPLSIQVLTESGDWLLRVESIQIESNGGPSSSSGWPSSSFSSGRPSRSPATNSTIRLTAERSRGDVVVIEATYQRWLLHERDATGYALLLESGSSSLFDATSQPDAYSVTAMGEPLRLQMLHGDGLKNLMHN